MEREDGYRRRREAQWDQEARGICRGGRDQELGCTSETRKLERPSLSNLEELK
jgi:hypothetical protein